MENNSLEKTLFLEKKSPEEDNSTDFLFEEKSDLEDHTKVILSEFVNRQHDSDKYLVEDKIGQGGMGAIYRALDQNLRRVSVLKVILPGVMENALLFHRFIKEAQITGQLEHPNIVPVHELGLLDESKLYFSMKFIDGEALSTILKKLRNPDTGYAEKFDQFTLLTIFRKVCDAVAYAHSKGVLHRDIKPGNVMVGEYGEVLLMDWGLACSLDQSEDLSDCDESEYDEKKDSSETEYGTVKGTPAYMSPEQANGVTNDIDHRNDIFLLGGTLYAIGTLQVPFTGNDLHEILEKAKKCIFIPPGERAPDREIPEELCRIILKAMSCSQDDRYQTVEELTEDLDNLMAGNTGSHQKQFKANEFLMQEGERGIEAYVILSGKVKVYRTIRGEPVNLMLLGSGDIIGEMALILKAPRTATVQAIEDTEVVVLTEDIIKQELDCLPPWMGKVIDSLAGRLRKSNVNVHPLMSGNCTYQVLNQLLLIHTCWSTPRIAPSTNKTFAVINTDKLLHVVSINLGIPRERVMLVISQLFDSRLITPDDTDDFYIPNFELFCQFIEYVRQKSGINASFEQSGKMSFCASNDQFILQRQFGNEIESGKESLELTSHLSDELLEIQSSDDLESQFEKIFETLRKILESEVV